MPHPTREEIAEVLASAKARSSSTNFFVSRLVRNGIELAPTFESRVQLLQHLKDDPSAPLPDFMLEFTSFLYLKEWMMSGMTKEQQDKFFIPSIRGCEER